MKKNVIFKLAAAAMVFSLMLPMSASAKWINEELGPGEAVWVEDTLPDGSTSSGETPQDSVSPVYEPSENIIIPVSPEADNQQEAQQPEAETQPDDSAQQDASASSDEAPQETQAEAKPDETAGVPESGGEEAQLPANSVMSNGRILYTDKPMIALTYDDGPNPKVGNRIMDVMAANNGRATFFLVGNRVPTYTSEVQRMAAEGHEIANHSYSHKYLNKYGADVIRDEVAKCNAAVQAACGVTPSVMRLPGGNKNSTVLSNVNMPIVLWNIDTRDWDHKNAQKTINEVMSKVKDGDVILMHELYNATADASDYLIPTLSSQGYQLVTVSELAKYKGVALQPGKVYYSF